MATPTVAGGAALMRQYFVEGRYPHGSASAGDRLNLLAPTLKAAVAAVKQPVRVGSGTASPIPNAASGGEGLVQAAVAPRQLGRAACGERA